MISKTVLTEWKYLQVRNGVGGDLFLMLAEEKEGDGRSVGDVMDIGDATYTGII